MESENKGSPKGFAGDVYDFFCSVKLSIVVLIALALTSIFGTVVEQGKDPAAYVEAYGEGVGKVIQLLNLGDMYHSWWFLVLLALLLINITFCSIRRFPHAVRLMRDRNPVFDGRPVAIHERREYTLKGRSLEQAAEGAQRLLAETLGKPVRQDVDGKAYFLATRGAWSRMGVYLTHSSLFLFAVGAQIGVWAGVKGFVEIPEGMSIREVGLRSGGSLPLDFEVRCDKFEVSFYPDPATGRPTGRPKDYKSWLSVIENGKTVVQKTIEVNDPLIYKGIYFYQSSYGQRAGRAGYLSVYGPRRNLVADRAKLGKGEALELEGGAKLRLLDLTTDLRGTGPAVLVAVDSAAGVRAEPVVLQKSDGPPSAVGDFFVRMDDLEASMYTGLQVAKDPGVPVIWAGCILITIGLLMAFFVSHRRVWIRVTATDSGVRVLLAGNASRNRIAFEKWFETLADRAKESFEN